MEKKETATQTTSTQEQNMIIKLTAFENGETKTWLERKLDTDEICADAYLATQQIAANLNEDIRGDAQIKIEIRATSTNAITTFTNNQRGWEWRSSTQSWIEWTTSMLAETAPAARSYGPFRNQRTNGERINGRLSGSQARTLKRHGDWH